jgi:acetoin utilization deacetylase AcuC-like enzyme
MSPLRPRFLHHPSSAWHDTGGHPESAGRIQAILTELSARDWLGWESLRSPAVPRKVLELVHPARYVTMIERAAASGGGLLDPDTIVSEGSFEAALHACGGAVALADWLLHAPGPADGPRIGFSAHRPPGHHALPERAMGFCLFNSIAVAAAWAVREAGVRRVLVLDWDVHHGNGTNDTFLDSAEVLFVSIHQSPLYPGTGAPDELGVGAGHGYTINLPVPPGSGDREFTALVDGVLVPVARSFEPGLILVSAGFDAHRDDPLASCQVTEQGFARMAASIRELAGELSAPVGCVLEGGYHVPALVRSLIATMEALGGKAQPPPPPALAEPEPSLLSAARARLASLWPVLAG